MGFFERFQKRNDMDNKNGTPVRAEGIALVGQPYQLKSWCPTVLIVCNCEAKEPLMVVGSSRPTQCPHCKKTYQIARLEFDALKNKFNVGLAVGVPRDKDNLVPA